MPGGGKREKGGGLIHEREEGGGGKVLLLCLDLLHSIRTIREEWGKVRCREAERKCFNFELLRKEKEELWQIRRVRERGRSRLFARFAAKEQKKKGQKGAKPLSP